MCYSSYLLFYLLAVAKLKFLAGRIKALPTLPRLLLGILLLIGGILWFLPILGLWMIPLGLFVLSSHFRWARQSHLFIQVRLRKLQRQRWLARWRGGHK